MMVCLFKVSTQLIPSNDERKLSFDVDQDHLLMDRSRIILMVSRRPNDFDRQRI